MFILGKDKIRKKSIEIGLVLKKSDEYSFPSINNLHFASPVKSFKKIFSESPLKPTLSII